MKNQKLPYVCKWMSMSQEQVLDKFQGFKNAYTDGEGNKRFVYIQGDRSDKVLLVAHADTVWQHPIKMDIHDGIVFSSQRFLSYDVKYNKYTSTKIGIGIGADDRAGCAIVWKLRNLGHSILITSGEEDGCKGSKWIINSPYWEEEINLKHQFAVQFDRRGLNDAVFYNIGTKKFVDYIKQETGYKPQSGFSTDIKHLCKNICGVNLSVGYYSEHQPDERLVIDQWQNTLSTAYSWLKKPNLPRFDLDKSDLFSINYNTSNNYGYGYPHYDEDYEQSWHNSTIVTPVKIIDQSKEVDISTATDYGPIVCPHCNHRLTQDEWFSLMFICPGCKQEI